MQIFNYCEKHINIDSKILDVLSLSYQELHKILFIDIETTGLTPKNCSIYLIGCGYYSDNMLNITLYFADYYDDEKEIINKYCELIKEHPYLIHFNGQKFDLPFIDFRAQKYNIDVPEFSKSIDLYKIIKPFKSLLSLPNLKQKTIEDFLLIERKDTYSGGELISVYKEYVKTYLNNPYEDELNKKLELLLLHNYEDVLNMHKLLPVLNYTYLNKLKFEYKNMEINKFNTYNNDTKIELIITCEGIFDFLPNNLIIKKQNGIYIKINKSGSAIVRIPIVNDKMKYYMPDYKNYYYLIDQDICIHKSACYGIDKEKRINATKYNCFVNVEGDKIPCPLDINDYGTNNTLRLLKYDYKEKEAFILLSEFENLDNSIKSIYLSHLIYGFS